MAVILTRKAALLAKTEVTEGTDPTPTAGSNGVLVSNIRINPNPNVIETNEVTPSLDPFDAIVGGMSMGIDFDVYLKGTSAAGTAPEWASLLKACGWAETITASAIPASPEALAAGGGVGFAILGATAAATANLYRGMPLNLTSLVTLATFISDYTVGKAATLTDTAGTNLVATTSYQIPINVLYTPASSSIGSVTIWIHDDGLLYKFNGCRGNVQFRLDSGGPAMMSFSMRGMFGSLTDAALPTVTYDSTRPPIWKGGGFTINKLPAAGQQLTLDCGNQLAQPDNPNATEGFDPAVITMRNMQGTMNPNMTLVATRDIMGDFRAGTKRSIHGRLGSTAGNRVALTIPSALYLNRTPGDRNGVSISDVPFGAEGQDAGAFIAIW